MGVMEIILGILILLVAVVVVAAITFQEGHDAGLGAIAGGIEGFFNKGQSRSFDDILARVTKIAGIAFVVLILLVNAILFFMH